MTGLLLLLLAAGNAAETALLSGAPFAAAPAVRFWISDDGHSLVYELPRGEPPPRLFTVPVGEDGQAAGRAVPMRFRYPEWAKGEHARVLLEPSVFSSPSFRGSTQSFAISGWSAGDDLTEPMPVWICDGASGACEPLPFPSAYEAAARFSTYYARPSFRGDSLFFYANAAEGPARLCRARLPAKAIEEVLTGLSGALSPDGRFLATASKPPGKGLPRLRLVSLRDGRETFLGAGGAVVDLAFSPDGKKLAVARMPDPGETVLTVQETSRESKPLEVTRAKRTSGFKESPFESGARTTLWPRFSPDSKSLFFSAPEAFGKTQRIVRFDLDTGRATALTPRETDARQPEPAQGGRRMYWLEIKEGRGAIKVGDLTER